MRSLLKDIIALVIFLSVGGTAGYIFYLEQTLEPEYVGKQPVGQIVTLKNPSVRIPGDRTVEIPLKKPGNVYLYETIKVSRKPGSNITFRLDPAFYKIGSELTLREGAIIKFTPEGFRTEGRVSILNDDGTVRDLEGSFQAKVDSAGVTFEVIRISLINPVNLEILSREERERVSFRWSEDAGLKDKMLQIALQPDFERIVQEIPVPDGESSIFTDVPPGTWYWRIKATAEGRSYTGPESLFSVYRYKPPVILGPSRDKPIVWWNRLSVDLSWEESVIDSAGGSNPADFYQLELTRDGTWRDFKPILLGENTRYRLTEELLREDGTYRFRITPTFGFLKTLASADSFQQIVASGRAESDFTVERSADVRPLALEYPPDGAVFNTIEARNGIAFNWEKDREMDRFRVVLASDPGLNTVVATETLTWFSWEQRGDFKPGQYYWKVLGETARGVARESEVRSFRVNELEGNVALIHPESGRQLELEADNPLVNFRWQSDLPGTEYRFTLYRGNEEKPFVRETLADSQFSLNLAAPQTYRWQVSLVDPLGRTLKSSAVNTFRTERPFRAPRMIYPPEGGNVDLVGEREISLIWEKIGGADSYLVELYPVTSGRAEQEPVLRTETKEPLLHFKELTLLRSGEYEIRLSSKRLSPPEGLVPVTEPSRNAFSVGELVFYSPAELLSPANGAGFDLLRVRREGVRFSWNRPSKMEAFQLEIFSVGNTFDPVKTIRTTDTAMTVRELGGGEFLWRIRCWDDRGREAPVSPFGRFTVGDIPRLNSPEISFPAEGSGINMELYDSLVISWKESPGAEYYVLRLFDLKNNRKITEQTVRGTRYDFDQLDQLDVGTFYVEVQAFRENRDVSPPMIQSSAVVRSTFSIFLKETYDRPNIISPDVQYTR